MEIRDLDLDGEFWRVSIPLVASMNKTLEIPRPYRQGPRNIANQFTAVQEYGLVIRGIVLNFYTSAASNVQLIADDPWAVQGTSTPLVVYEYPVGVGGAYRQSLTNIVIPLSPGGYRSDASPTTANGATLRLVTSTNLTDGFLLAYGIHTQKDFGRYGYTGSPASFAP